MRVRETIINVATVCLLGPGVLWLCVATYALDALYWLLRVKRQNGVWL